jgi:tetratricopeptide (TPR) repeat protein
MVSNDSAAPVRATCPRCGREADLQAKSVRNWFTVFFIPVFPISRRKAFTQCPLCGAQFAIAPEELRQRITASEQAQNSQAIALYNSLRASPGNSITLDQLMKMYASMKEYDQAISAARDFPTALDNSEQCMATLGRVYLAKNDFGNALRWLDAAVARNGQLGEAHYYKALTHMLTQPPDYSKAIASARAARSVGYEDADSLLRQAEAKARGE